MDFGEVLSRAWHIIWRHKILWIFGIFAGLVSQAGSGAGSRGGSRIQYTFDSGDFANGIVIPPEFQHIVDNIEHFFNTAPVWFWVVLGVSLFILGIAFWALSIIGRAGLVRGSVDADEDASLRFGSLFNRSLYYFGRLFLFDLLIFVCSLVVTVAVVLLIVVFGVATLGIGLLCLIPLLCLLVPLGWVLSIYLIQVQVALVAEDLGVWPAFARAWKVVTGRLGEMVVMGLILFIIRLAAGILLAIPFGMVFAPFISSLLTTGGITSAAVTAALVIGLVLLPFAILAEGILEAYVLGAWTLTFRRLTGKKAGNPAATEPVAPVAPAAPVPPEAPSAPVDLPPQA
ncbi:hypothetical protein LARV_00204 [Longilinea arvoryzae]|uniref:Uncharacterized protein n=1 Tax=Longilinea arvoryzae TaxID=360412 RepID=A0A0S7BFN8_9CHLR|nr:hypothetical protein [Longilinea arvoryzae]GAP12469.1 hypothetical protein LARV_00204 [Longilinea arvoryzae]